MNMFNTMLQAAKDNKADLMTYLVSAGCDPNSANSIGQTCLHIAALWGSLDSGRILIEAKADVNRANDWEATPLHMAAQRNQTKFVELLLANGADPELTDGSGRVPYQHAEDDDCRTLLGAPSTDLHKAVRERDISKLLALLADEGTVLEARDSEGRNALNVVASDGAPANFMLPLIKAKVDPAVRDDEGETALHHAVMRSDVYLTDLLLKAGAPTFLRNRKMDEYRSSGQWVKVWEDGTQTELNDAHATPLLVAIAALDEVIGSDDEGDSNPTVDASDAAIGVVELLLASGASVNAPDVQGRNALHAAMELEDDSARRRVTELVLRTGSANTTSGNANLGFEQTPLSWAAARGDCALVELLVAHKADPDLAGRQGLTPLHCAARGGKTKIVRALLAAGATVRAKDPNEREPADLARANRKNECVKILNAAATNVSEVAAGSAERVKVIKTKGDALLEAGRLQEAADCFAAGIEACTPASSGGVALQLSSVHKALRTGRARAIVEAASAAGRSEWAPSAVDLSVAVVDARVAVKLDPHHAAGWHWLIAAERLLGRNEDAVHTKEMALKAVGSDDSDDDSDDDDSDSDTLEDEQRREEMACVLAECRAASQALWECARKTRAGFLDDN